jgi:KAP family P-loop domain
MTETSTNNSEINLDSPLRTVSALQSDKLSRGRFAQAAADVLRKVSSSAGLVVSIEGAWGSGKTSVLALIEAILNKSDKQPQPLIVHFNPWLIGEKDALLRHFLSRIAGAIKLSDNTRDGKKVAAEIKAYSKAFDLVKLIPGAEPWASLIKLVVETAGTVTGAVADYKTPDIESYKKRVEESLRKFPRPIIVFIDDIDRLFPLEVFEMVRIIKAVGELPHVGYVLAWDSAYVSSALEKLGVPHPHSYLDKVVQVRMPLPRLSRLARRNLINDELNKLGPEVLLPRFKAQDDRLAHLYQYGLRDLLEQPRDIARVFNAVRLMEPLLRDEIVFADILGLTALSVKAPSVFELIRKEPRLFVGRLADDLGLLNKSKDVIEDGEQKRSAAYETASSPNGVRQIVHFLFPAVAEAEGSYAVGIASHVEGNIAHPAKLAIALQLSLTDGDVSIKTARRYLQQPNQRAEVLASLTSENCSEFLELLGEVGKSLQGAGILDIDELCIAIARLPEQPLFVERARAPRESFSLRAEDTVLEAVSVLILATDKSRMSAVAEKIATDPVALSCAAEIISQSYVEGPRKQLSEVTVSAESKESILKSFASNILKASEDDVLYEKINPGFIFWTTARLVPDICPNVYKVLKDKDGTLDKFAVQILGGSWDSTNGASFCIPRDDALLSVYCPIEQFKVHAAARLEDLSLVNPTRAAWRSVVEGKRLYGVDGSDARH